MRAILFDLDGVIYQGDRALPGAVDTLAWVRQENIPHLFVTNTTSRPVHAIVERLRDYGLDAAADDILTPAVAACRWLQQNLGDEPVALFVPEATRGEFEACRCVDDEAESGAAAVIIGDLGEGWNFRTLNRAFRLLQADSAVELIALGMTRYWKAADGLRLDTGPFVRALEYATGKHARVLGKPAEAFFTAALGLLDHEAGETVMIGDDIQADIRGAQAAGLKGVLVRTGKFRDSDLDGEIRPDAVLDSVAELPGWWQAQAR